VDQGAFSASMGGISTVIPGSSSVFNNFSLVHSSTTPQILISTAQRFSLSELTTASLGIHVPVNDLGHFGLELSNYGFESYSEQLIKLKYARKLGRTMAISGSLGMHNVLIEDFGSKQNIVVDLAFSGQLSKQLTYGIQISNPEKITINDQTVLISRVAFGLGYKVSQKVAVFGELEKELEEAANFMVGLAYKLHPKLQLRAGYATLAGQVTFGFKWQIMKELNLETAFLFDSLLGTTPVLTLSYRKPPKEPK